MSVPGYAMIRQMRSVDLVQGRNRPNFADVAAYIDPTTVSFESLTSPDSTRVIEQSFQFDLDADVLERNRVAQRNPVRGPFCRLYPGQPGDREGIPLGQSIPFQSVVRFDVESDRSLGDGAPVRAP